ncbi:MAG: hypothetical protein ACTSPS_07540 [Promethearchaeota archaeon]
MAENKAFDQVWSMLSILIIGVLESLFSSDMWTGKNKKGNSIVALSNFNYSFL